MTRRVVEKLCTKKVCVDFLAPKSFCKKQKYALPLAESSIDATNLYRDTFAEVLGSGVVGTTPLNSARTEGIVITGRLMGSVCKNSTI